MKLRDMSNKQLYNKIKTLSDNGHLGTAKAGYIIHLLVKRGELNGRPRIVRDRPS